MPPLTSLPVPSSPLPPLSSLRSPPPLPWVSAVPPAVPPSAPRSADLFMILFVSLFLFLTAAVLRLVPWLSPLPSQPRWAPRDALPYASPSEADALLPFRSFRPASAPAPPAEHASYEALLEIGDRVGSAKLGLSDDQIAILPVYLCPDPALPDDSHLRRGAKCAVCRDAYRKGDPVCILPCADEFHADCIAPWLRMQANCPLCRCRFA